MSRDKNWFIAGLSIMVGLVWAAGACAQEPASAQEVPNSPVQFRGEVTGNDVYVRSGPGEGYYATTKVNRGDQLTVVGIRFGWLKVMPPAGSFSYIPQVWVERSGDGSVGRVTKDGTPVRAGSQLNEMKGTEQTTLNANDRVVILNTKDEYFMIQPPAGAYLYISKDYVRPIQQVDAFSNDNNAPADAGQTNTGVSDNTNQTGTTQSDVVGQNDTGVSDTVADVDTGVQTDLQDTNAAAGTQPSTQPTAGAADPQVLFAALEAQFNTASAQPIDEQPVDELLKGYEPLASGNLLPESMRRIAVYRVAILQERAKAQQELAALKKDQAEFDKKQQAARAEQQELTNRIAASDVKIYAAVGELRPSSLQGGKGILLRLTDPANGRTVVYVRSEQPVDSDLIGQFVGVKGVISEDVPMNIQIVTPTAIEKVDPAEVNTKVAAQIVPPSIVDQK